MNIVQSPHDPSVLFNVITSLHFISIEFSAVSSLEDPFELSIFILNPSSLVFIEHSSNIPQLPESNDASSCISNFGSPLNDLKYFLTNES